MTRVLLLQTVDRKAGLVKGREFTGDTVFARSLPNGGLAIWVEDDNGQWIKLKGQQGVTLADGGEAT